MPFWQMYLIGGITLVAGVLALWRGRPQTGLRLFGNCALHAGSVIVWMTAFFHFDR